MKAQEIRDLSLEDLRSQISDTRKELVNLRFQHSMRKLETPHKLKATRRILSRMLTIEAQMLNGETVDVAKKAPKAESKPKADQPKKDDQPKEDKE